MPAKKSNMQKSSATPGKKTGAAVSHAHASSRYSDDRVNKGVNHAQPRSSGYAAEGYARKSPDKDARLSAEHARKKNVRDAYDTRYTPPKKKKKFKLKRFLKKLGKQIAAFGARLVEVQDHPVEETGYATSAATSAAVFSQAQPVGGASRARNRSVFSSGKPVTATSVFRDVKKGFRSVVRAAARGIYLGIRGLYQFLMKLPHRTLLIGSGAFGLVLITVIVLAIALPGNQAEKDRDDKIAAFTGFESEQSALENAILDGSMPGEMTADGTLSMNADASAEQINSALSTDGAAETVFTGQLKSGDDGAIVSEIQSRLMILGYMDSDEPTQHFGPLTQSALKSFQRHNGLGDDGIIGQETYSALMSDDAKIYVMQLGDSGPDVEGVQERLYELGYLDNKANIQGNFGEKTEAAAKAFQKKNDLTVDGKVGTKTQEMLYGEDVVGNAYTLGDENQVIKDCQTALKKLGYITFKPDGVMGKATVSAIKAFQQANGLTRDGALGPATRDMILSGKAEEMVMQLGDYGTDVKNMQTRLAKLNYLSSANATGYFGEITQDAVKAFQKRAGLTTDGKVGAVTLTMMNSSSAKKAASPPSSSKENSSSSSSSGSSSSSSSSSGSSSASVSDKTGVEKLIALAESKIGSKYVRGAKGPNSFDCSGFVFWCLKNAGVNTSYMTSIAWRSNSRFQRSTSMSSLQRGDILVFSGESDSAGHVGIYIGGGKMIDASSSEGKVRQSSSVLTSGGYWSRHFICAYRVF